MGLGDATKLVQGVTQDAHIQNLGDDELKKIMESPESVRAALAEAEKKAREDEKNKGGSLKIHIELDLAVEVHLTAKLEGKIVIGLL